MSAPTVLPGAALLAILGLLTLPLGLAALRTVGRQRTDPVEAFGLGLALASLVVFLLGLAKAPLVPAGVALALLALASLVQLTRAGVPDWRPGRETLLLAPIVLALALWQGPWFSHTADVFYHVAAVRSILLKGEAFATLPLYAEPGALPDPTSSGWHTLLALGSAAAGLDAAVAWGWAHALVAGLPTLALAAFARRVSGRASIGVAAGAIWLAAYNALDLREGGYPNQIGYASLFACLSLALPAAATKASGVPKTQQSSPSRPDVPPASPLPLGEGQGEGVPGEAGNSLTSLGTILLAISLVGLTAVHIGLASAALAIVALAAIARALEGCRRAAAALALAASVGGAAGLLRSVALGGAPLVDDRVGVPAYPAAAPSLGGPVLGPLGAILAGDVAALRTPACLAIAVALAWLVHRARRSKIDAPRPSAPRAAALDPALAMGAVLPLLCAAAASAPLPPALAYWLVRTAIPLGPIQTLVLGWTLVLCAHGVLRPSAIAGSPLASRLPLCHPGAAAAPRATAVLVGGVLLARITASALAMLIPVLGPARPTSHSFASSRAYDLRTAWADRVAALRALPPGTTLLAAPDVALHLTGLANVYVTATPQSHTPAAVERAGGWLRRGDALDAIDLTDPTVVWRTLRAGRASYLFVDDSAPTWPTWRDRPPAGLAVQASGSTWRLLRAEPSAVDAMLPAAPAGWSVLPAEPVAGDIALVRVEGASGSVALRAPSGDLATSAPLGPDGVAALALPSGLAVARYDLLLRAPTGDRVLGSVPVGREYEGESFPLRYSATGAGPGWTLYDQTFYQRHGAARTPGPATTARPIAPLPPGRYAVLARVYEYPGSRLNEVVVRLGGASVGMLWGGELDGPRWVSNIVQTTTTATTLELAAPRVEQIFAVVDGVRIVPAPP